MMFRSNVNKLKETKILWMLSGLRITFYMEASGSFND